MKKYKKWIIAFSFVIVYAIISLLKLFPEFVEQYYSNGLYIVISKMMRFAFGWLPFSVGDILYTIATIYMLRWLFLNRGRLLKDTKNWLLDILSAFSIAYLAFHVLWAFNYYRMPLYQSLGLERDYSTEALESVTEMLISKANAAHLRIIDNDTLKVELPYSKSEIKQMVPEGYNNLKSEFPSLNYSPCSIKTSLYSTPLTYMGFSGYLNPFTNEAQVDGLIPKFKFPTTAAHEAAHQLGYAAENEANFIGCLASINHDDEYFQYSGYAFALRYCLFDLYRRNPEAYKRLVPEINKGILKNYQEVNDFWSSYENPFEAVFETTYDNFLKANNQQKGMKTYSYVVALFVNYFKA